jgi:chorismate mutase
MTDIDITKLRASIDAVDSKIIALLKERCDYVKQVGMTKKARQQAGKSFIRSGREADMVRGMYNTFKTHPFPAPAAAHLWRIIIAASLSLETSLTISAFWSEAKQDVYWLSREYFGNFTPTVKQTTTRRVLADVMEEKAEVGALPMPDQSPEGSWWLKLPEDIKIFACVPFIMTGETVPPVLLIARVDPEPTGDDVTLISIETEADVSQSRLKAIFDKHKAQVNWLSAESFPSGHRIHLIEMKGYYKLEDEALQAVSRDVGSSLISLRHLGSYAVPIRY